MPDLNARAQLTITRGDAELFAELMEGMEKLCKSKPLFNRIPRDNPLRKMIDPLYATQYKALYELFTNLVLSMDFKE